MQFTLQVNGRQHTVDVDSDTPLLWVLRDEIELKGAKFGCSLYAAAIAVVAGCCAWQIEGRGSRWRALRKRRQSRRWCWR